MHIYILNIDLKVIVSTYIVKKCKNLTEKWDGRLALEDSETSDGNPVSLYMSLKLIHIAYHVAFRKKLFPHSVRLLCGSL